MPATYIPHLKLSWGGVIGNPEIEQWANAVRFDLDGLVPEPDRLQPTLDAAAPVLTTWFTSQAAAISVSAKLRWAKLVWIQSNGKQRDLNTAQVARNDQGNQSGSSPYMAAYPHWYQTQALTLRTALSRGRGHAGRIFPPVTAAMTEGETPYIQATVADGMASAFATCLSDLCTEMADFLVAGQGVLSYITPAVASAGDGAEGSFKAPLLVPITGVVCDRVGDVQHRRTRQVTRLEGALAGVTPFGDF